MEENANIESKSSGSKNKNEESSLSKRCRICYEGDRENNELIHPCKCRGSVGFVHEDCLKTWLLSTAEDLHNRCCELCHTVFQMKYKIISYFSWKEFCDEIQGAWLFIPVLVGILVLIIIIIYYLSLKYQSNDSSSDDKFYVIVLIVGCSFAGLIIICILLYLLKKSFIKRKIEDWKILNQDLLAESHEKIETEEHNLFTQPAENNLLIIPKVFWICGKKIRTPQVMPLGLIPVYEEGVVIGYKSEYKEKLIRSDVLNNTNKELASKTYQFIGDRGNVTL